MKNNRRKEEAAIAETFFEYEKELKLNCSELFLENV